MSGNHADSSETQVAARVRQLESTLESAGLLNSGELDEILSGFMERSSPRNGARIAARAWTDDGFRHRLLADADQAIQEFGLSTQGPWSETQLVVVENTATVHNVVVCTLCSCYPILLLGPSPTWYKSDGYRANVVRDPRGVLAQFGLSLDPSVKITVWDSTAETRYMVLPQRPAGTAALSENELALMVSRDGLIGTAAV